jgi:hypothetical protein
MMSGEITVIALPLTWRSQGPGHCHHRTPQGHSAATIRRRAGALHPLHQRRKVDRVAGASPPARSPAFPAGAFFAVRTPRSTTSDLRRSTRTPSEPAPLRQTHQKASIAMIVVAAPLTIPSSASADPTGPTAAIRPRPGLTRMYPPARPGRGRGAGSRPARSARGRFAGATRSASTVTGCSRAWAPAGWLTCTWQWRATIVPWR